MRYRLVIAAATLLALTMANSVRADMRLGYVDIQRALNDCRNGKSAKAEFRTRLDRVQRLLQSEQSDVQRLKDELEKKGALMQPDQRQNLENDYSKKLRDFQDDYKSNRDQLQEKDNELTGAIVRDLATVVRKIGQKDGYTVVMEKGSLLWATSSIDITDEVIRAYDAMNVKPGSLGAEASGGAPSQGTTFGASAQPLAGGGAPVSGGDNGGRSTISK